MIRTGLYLFAGLLLGLTIHLVVILVLPRVATNDLGTRIAAITEAGKLEVLGPVAPGAANPLHLDPNLAYAVCRLDLSKGPGVLTGTLPRAFWSVGVHGSGGNVIYSTTNRDGIGQNLDLGIFNAVQTRLLAEQKIDVEQGLLIVESPVDEVIIVVRLAPEQPVMRARYEDALKGLACGNITL